VAQAIPAEIRLYNTLFAIPSVADVPEGEDWKSYLNPESEQILTGYLEPALADHPTGFTCQFERLGYFCVDRDSTAGRPVFNRTVTLKDEWAKLQKAAT
jgi:glutaminyl-tRNA synthetase